MAITEDNTIDTLQIDDDTYALISGGNISFISGIQGGSIEEVVEHEQKEFDRQPLIQREIKDDYCSITFLPTLDCNLRCIYCYSCGGDDKAFLSTEVAIQAIDNLAKAYKPHENKVLYLHFLGGGEPFLNFACIEGVTNYAKTVFSEVHITIVTNGTFGKRELEWLVEHDVGVRISYDGVAHGKQRPYPSGQASQKVVEENIRRIAATGMPFKVKVTVTNESVEHMAESVEYIASLGVRDIHVKPVIDTGDSRGEKNLTPDVTLFVDNVMKTIDMVLKKDLDVRLVNSFDFQPSTGHYCRSCCCKSPTITPGGHLSSCVEISRPHEKFSDVMLYGDTLSPDGFRVDKKNVKFLQQLHYQNYKKCEGCSIRKLCLGGCPIEAAWDTGDFFTPSEYRCQLNKQMFPKLLRMASKDKRVLSIVTENLAVTA